MIDRLLAAITCDDIEALLCFRRSEGRTLDSKGALLKPYNNGVRDFLADVTAFATSDLVKGIMKDGNGVAKEVVDVPVTGLDEELRQIDDHFRSVVNGNRIMPS